MPDDPVTRWARDVVRGQIVAGELVCHAAERHLKDLVEGGSRGLRWDWGRADHALGFFPECLTITAGSYEGKPFELLPWTMFCVGSLFGWRNEDGGLRFRSSWWETGKGQAKSPAMAAVGLYMMGFYGVARSQVYAIAWDKDQANVLFKDAVAMCRAPIPGTDPDDQDSLERRGEVVIRGRLDNAWRIEHPATGSRFQSLANGDAISGPRPNLVLADEIHEFKNADAIELWKRALAKASGDALMMLGTNTPASTQIVGTNYSEFYQKVAKGEVQDDTSFAFIARVDKDDEPFENEECWPKALPALGLTFPAANIRREVASAKLMLSTKMSVGRLYFGIPIGAVEFWIAEEAWVAVQGTVDEAAMKGLPCWLSLDLSQKNDLTALTACWEGEKDGEPHLFVKTWYWTTQNGLSDRSLEDNAPYTLWVEQGVLAAVGGSVIDKTFVAAQVKRILGEHDVQFLAFDPAGIDDFIAACDEVGLETWKWKGPKEPAGRGLMLVSHAQGKRIVFEEKQLCMPHSIERLEDRILEKSITVDASPVTYSCAANAAIDTDGQNNRCFHKTRSRGRIDGMVTIAMAVGAATSDLKPVKREYQVVII